MTYRSVRPKVLLLRDLRRLKSGARHTTTATDAAFIRRAPQYLVPEKPVTTRIPRERSVVDFRDSEKLFASITTKKLLKSSVIVKAASIDLLSDVGLWVWKSRLNEGAVLRPLILGFTKHTFYSHFCAGKDLSAANATAKKLWESGLTAMLDYGLENANDKQSCDRNMQEFIRTIKSSKTGLNSQHVKFVAVKMTAICPHALLERVSDLLRWEYQNSSTVVLPWKLKSLPIFCDASPFYHTTEKPKPLTPEEEHDLRLAQDRLFMICKSSLDCDQSILLDAEETRIQPAIDYLTYAAVLRYGSKPGQRPLIFNTVQAYLKDSYTRLVQTVEAAEKLGIRIGIKLVRGAYMKLEIKESMGKGGASPIHDSIKHTHACYDKCSLYLLQKIHKGTAAAVLATHNIQSGEIATMKAVNLGIDRQSHCLHFAQLYGMAEAMSFGLKNGGFNVSKYVPFGTVDQIMPYLMRRAEENKCVLGASARDIKLMRGEIIRRLSSSLKKKHDSEEKKVAGSDGC